VLITNSSVERVTSYESFFGFREAPFSLAPNTRFRFDTVSHHGALTQVTYALQRREPVVVVTGEIGTGKTLLCRTVLERLDRKTFLSIISDPLLGREDLLKQMLQDFGIISKDRTKVAATSRPDLTHALNQFLSSLAPLDAHAVVIIDEAQHVRPDVLEEIRLLSNIQDQRGTMLQIILVGQTDLDSLLARPELQSLRQRITRHMRLEPLSAAEVAHYIEHRLSIAREGQTRSDTPGARELERAMAEWRGPTAGVTFTPAAVDRVARLSRGIPRVINLLCDRALESACAAQSHVVDDSTIDEAARALGVRDVQRTAAPEPSVSAKDVPRGVTLRTPAAGTHWKRDMAAAASLAIGVVAIWFGVRTVNRNPSTRTQANGAAPTQTETAPRVAPPSPETAAAPAGAPAASMPANAPAPAGSPSSESFEIVVASFRTAARASAVAADAAALALPIRQRGANGWQQLIAGPFSSRAQAEAAQQRLQRAGFSGTQIIPTGR
jgi:general secretion pathway protein A